MEARHDSVFSNRDGDIAIHLSRIHAVDINPPRDHQETAAKERAHSSVKTSLQWLWRVEAASCRLSSDDKRQDAASTFDFRMHRYGLEADR